MNIYRQRTENYRRRPLTEAEGIRAARRCFTWKYCFENVFYHQNTEADLLLISTSRYLTEVEVKLTLADWNNDRKKFKVEGGNDIFGNPVQLKIGQDCMKYFYYAVPRKLLAKEPEWIDKRFGLIVIDESDYMGGYEATVIRQAQVLSKKKASKHIIMHCFKSAYYKAQQADIDRVLKYDATFKYLREPEYVI